MMNYKNDYYILSGDWCMNVAQFLKKVGYSDHSYIISFANDKFEVWLL